MKPAKTNREGHFGETHVGLRTDRALAELLPDMSRERIAALIRDGKLRVNAKISSKPSAPVRAPAPFRLDLPPPAPSAAVAQNIPLDIVYEDDALLVLNKPPGMVVHPAAGHADGTLVNALLYHCKGQLSGIGGVARPGIVHRIDKDTSGLLVTAKSDSAHIGLSKQFAEHTVARKYYAIVQGHPRPASATVRGNIGRSRHNRKKMAIVSDTEGKHAVTHYERLEKLRDAALVQCQLETGRTHQVRVHMASIGHALLGDPAYGGPQKTHRNLLRAQGFTRQALHAATLGFIHPITAKKLVFSSEIPADMQELLNALRVL